MNYSDKEVDNGAIVVEFEGMLDIVLKGDESVDAWYVAHTKSRFARLLR